MCPVCGNALPENDDECRICAKRLLVARRRAARGDSSTEASGAVPRWRASSGFFLSAPLTLMYLWGFGGLSDAANNLWLGLMALLFIATLPGSAILLVAGFVAAFSGKVGELVAMGCMFLSVVNAHAMGMIYFGRPKKQDNK